MNNQFFAAAGITMLLACGAAQERHAAAVAGPDGADGAPLRLERDLVTMTVTVSDGNGRCVAGLGKDHFEVYDGRVRQDIAFFSNEDAPATVGIVYDVSGSMKDRIAEAHHALRRFLDTCHPDDEFFVIGYSDRASLLSDFTPSAAAVADRLTFAAAGGKTALYDAVYLGLEKARQGRHARKALVVISDGQDNASRYTFGEVRRATEDSNVTVYAIGVTTPFGEEITGRTAGGCSRGSRRCRAAAPTFPFVTRS